MKDSKAKGAAHARAPKKKRRAPRAAKESAPKREWIDDYLARVRTWIQEHGTPEQAREFGALSQRELEARAVAAMDKIVAEERRELDRESRRLDAEIADASVASLRANLSALESSRSFLGSIVRYALEVRGDDLESLQATMSLVDEADKLTHEIDTARARAAEGAKALEAAHDLFRHGIAAACSRLLAKHWEKGSPEEVTERLALELGKPAADLRAALAAHETARKLVGPVSAADFAIGEVVGVHGRTVSRWRTEPNSRVFDLWLKIPSEPAKEEPMLFGLAGALLDPDGAASLAANFASWKREKEQ